MRRRVRNMDRLTTDIAKGKIDNFSGRITCDSPKLKVGDYAVVVSLNGQQFSLPSVDIPYITHDR